MPKEKCLVIVDKKKLKARIIEKFETQSAFANTLYKYDSYVSNVLNGYRMLDNNEIAEWSVRLEIPFEEIPSYFFVPNDSQKAN